MKCCGNILVVVAVVCYVGGAVADSNFLTGANDVVVVRSGQGELVSSPFSLQVGKKDIWLPRSGHIVTIRVNNKEIPQTMILDGEGVAYFSQQKEGKKPSYRFWSALFGTADPPTNKKSNLATSALLESMALQEGHNSLEYRVTTSTGSVVSTTGRIFLVSNTAKLVVSDIDGTITRSDIRGIILPTLGISDWNHLGIVELYRKISDQGYMLVYLTSRAIGQAESTREYLNKIRDGNYSLPDGPVLLSENSVINAVRSEVIDGNPEVAKIAKLTVLRGLFPSNPLYAAYGNRDTDIMAYKALQIPTQRIFRIDEESILENVGTGTRQNIAEHTVDIDINYPLF